MENIFKHPTFDSAEHTEFSEYITDLSKELFFEGGINNIFSDIAVKNTVIYFTNVERFVRILREHYGKEDERVQKINSLFIKMSLTYFYNLFQIVATSTFQRKDFLNLIETTNLAGALKAGTPLLNALKSFAITQGDNYFLEAVTEYRAKCSFEFHFNELEKQEQLKANQSKEGCYIATMVYGSYDAQEVIQLRKFRDEVLKTNLFGKFFVHLYYFISPKMVKYLGGFKPFNQLCKTLIEITFKINQ